MSEILKIGITAFWVMDILNMPFMEIFDTVYPLNGLFWLIFILLISD